MGTKGVPRVCSPVFLLAVSCFARLVGVWERWCHGAGDSHTGMCSTTASTSSTTLDVSKLVKFVELLVYDYLQAKGFKKTGEKFAEERSNCARDRESDSRSKKRQGEDVARSVVDQQNTADEASSWYYLADKLALPELLRHNTMAPAGQRLTAVMEVLVQELAQDRIVRSRAPSSVSIAGLRDSKGRRRQVGNRHMPTSLEPQRSLDVNLSKSVGDVAATDTGTFSDISAGSIPKTSGHQSALKAEEGSGSESLPGGRGGGSTMTEAAGDSKERCKMSPLQGKMGASRKNLGARTEGGREAPRKHHTSSAKRGHGHSSPLKGNRASSAGGVLNKFQFSKDAIRRQQMSHENWIPDDLRMKMVRRGMAVIKENVFESVAHGSLVRKEKKRSSRSDLEIVKTQEKFGTKHQRPCALCEQSFSEVNLVLAVPFKAIVDLRIAWQKTLPQAKGSTTKTNRTMLMPPQCYNEVKVCAFCSQLFHDPLGYRPTWDMEVSRMRKKREQLAREKEREYWDPLRKATQAKDREHHATPPAPEVNQTTSPPSLLAEA